MPSDYERIEQAIAWLTDQVHQQPELADLARVLGLSAFHTQRLFRRWAGVSPKQFLEFLTVGHAKKMLADSRSVLDAAYGVGLSGPGRLHDQMVSVDALSPGEYKSGGAGIRIAYGIHESPFGTCLLAVTDRGICHLSFSNPHEAAERAPNLRRLWPAAILEKNETATRPYLAKIFPKDGSAPQPRLHLVLKGTNFQLKVWEALLRIPPGLACTYQEVARWIGFPRSARAVGSAVGANPVAYLIPCHRVIRRSGVIGEYRWGPARKKALLAWESAHHGSPLKTEK